MVPKTGFAFSLHSLMRPVRSAPQALSRLSAPQACGHPGTATIHGHMMFLILSMIDESEHEDEEKKTQ